MAGKRHLRSHCDLFTLVDGSTACPLTTVRDFSSGAVLTFSKEPADGLEIDVSWTFEEVDFDIDGGGDDDDNGGADRNDDCGGAGGDGTLSAGCDDAQRGEVAASCDG